jgi:hypothetical protein
MKLFPNASYAALLLSGSARIAQTKRRCSGSDPLYICHRERWNFSRSEGEFGPRVSHSRFE